MSNWAVWLLVLAVAGCSAHHSLPPDWHKDLPGTYVAQSGSFKESIIFLEGGEFRHEVFDATNSIVSEKGRWVVRDGRFEIRLQPEDTFTQYYNPETKQFSTNGQPFSAYVYWPFPTGTNFTQISPSPDYDYRLTRGE